MYRFFVGIDVSKQWIDASWTNGPHPQYLGQFENSIPGFKKLHTAVKKLTKEERSAWLFCFENTGTYSKLLVQWLCSQEIPCKEENALKISKEAGLRRGKSDKLDSGVICTYVFKNRDSIEPTKLAPPTIELMKKLLSRRDFLVRQRVARQTSLKEQKAEFSSEVFKTLEKHDTIALQHFAEEIQFVEEQIESLISSDEKIQKNSELARSVKGVGPVITWYMIAYTNNFQAFANSRKFASYTGIAPFPDSSGSSRQRQNHVNPMANKHIKALITNGALAALTCDTELRSYYQRKIAEGKAPGVVMNALKNKLVARLFAVVQRGTPFVATHNYA